MQTTPGTSLSEPPSAGPTSRRSTLAVAAVVTVVVYILDQVTKAWAVRALANGQPRQLLGSFLELQLTHNAGAAFSFVTGYTVVLTLVGAYTLSASGAGRSLCPKNSQFLLLMDPIPPTTAGSELEIHYDVCGLRAGTQFRGKLVLQPQTSSGKKAVKAKPLTVAIRDKADGPATRRRQDLQLGSAKPAAYTVELSVTDSQGRERKKVQKIRIH